MFPHRRIVRLLQAVCLLTAFASSESSYGQTAADVFDTSRVIDLRLEMSPGDWQTVLSDTSFDIPLPALLVRPGEEPLTVSVRRKSSTSAGGKVSLKIDINEYLDGQKWNGLTKLSLENGADASIIGEGLAWHLHVQAAKQQNYGYMPGRIGWINLTINGENTGVYANVEQPDKQFFRNRGTYINGQTWLYKQGEIGPPSLEFGEPHSDGFMALNYPPFADDAPTPAPSIVVEQLTSLINMHGMLTLGAVNAFTTNPDELFNKGKNFYFADFAHELADGKRQYYPWDLDAVFRRADANIYAIREHQGTLQQHPYQETILNEPRFRCQYNEIMLDLVNGPLSSAAISDALNEFETALTPWLAVDPSIDGGEVAGVFDSLRDWAIDREANVRTQLEADLPHFNRLGDVDCDGVVGRSDAATLARYFGSTENGRYGAGDLNRDGSVDFLDLAILQRNLLPNPNASVAFTPVPEPESLAALAAAFVTLGCFWRRRNREKTW
jgi:spore coat protein CotH